MEFLLDKLLTAGVTLAAAWLGVRIELRHLSARVTELRQELHIERGRINRIYEVSKS